MKLFLKKLVLITMVLVLSTGRSFIEVKALYSGDTFNLHIDTNGSNNQGAGLGIYECHYLDQPVSIVNTEGWDLTVGANAQSIVDYYSSHFSCDGHSPIVGELVDGKYFTGFVIYHVTYWNNGDLKFVGIQASYSDTAPNVAPVANNQTLTTLEDTALPITLTATDANSDPLTYIIVSQPTHGVLSGTGASVIYTPNANYFGPDSFTFKANDGKADSNIATVSITVTSVNDAPIADDQTVSTPEDTAKSITLTGSDIENDPLSFIVLTQPAHGTVVCVAAACTYTPNLNYNGQDSFTFKVNDGAADSNIATVTINVGADNDAPTADNQSVSTPEDTPLDITLTGSDPEDDLLSFIVLTNPAHGSLVFVIDHYVYTPALNYNGSDSFTFKVNDGLADSNVATVSINVGSTNDAPIADDQTVSTLEDTPLDITLTGSDPESDPLSFILLTQPTNGSVVCIDEACVYTPFANFNGQDSFTFKINDGIDDSNIATVTINVSPVNDIPLADDQNLTTPEDTPLDIILTGSDVEDDALTFEIVTDPMYGTVVFDTDHWVYTPNANYHGVDSFTFIANDGTNDSAEATVTITVTPVNDAPVAIDNSFTVLEGGTYDGFVTGMDPDDALQINAITPMPYIPDLDYILVSGPVHGSLTFNIDGTYHYVHDGSETTSDSFTFKVNDGLLDSNVATVTIEVTPVNDAPVANNAAFTLISGGIFNGNLLATDPDSLTLDFSVVTGPAHGILVLNPDGSYSYDHDGLTLLTDTFTYRVWDGEFYSNTATVTITITPLPPVNVAPITLPEAFTILEGGTEVGAVGGTDGDGDPITFVLVDDVTNGTLTFAANGAYTYVHNGTETTADTFRFQAFDGTAYSAIRTAYITITPVNDAPVAVNGVDETDFETALTGNIHNLVSDIDSTDWTVSVVSGPVHGTLVLNADGTFTYTPNTGFSGDDVFTFKANDGQLDSNIANFTITVNEDVIIDNPETPLTPLSFWWAYLLGMLFILIFFLRPNLKYSLVDKNGKETIIRRHIFSNGKDDLFIDLNDKNIEGLVGIDLVVYKQLVKRERGHKITFNLFKKPMKVIDVPEDMKETIEDQIKL